VDGSDGFAKGPPCHRLLPNRGVEDQARYWKRTVVASTIIYACCSRFLNNKVTLVTSSAGARLSLTASVLRLRQSTEIGPERLLAGMLGLGQQAGIGGNFEPGPYGPESPSPFLLKHLSA
jgi:hypothetical protein